MDGLDWIELRKHIAVESGNKTDADKREISESDPAESHQMPCSHSPNRDTAEILSDQIHTVFGIEHYS